MKNIIKLITVLKVCFVITFFASIAFATDPGASPGITSGGTSSGPQNAQGSNVCGSEMSLPLVYGFIAIGVLIFLTVLLTTRNYQDIEGYDDDGRVISNPTTVPLWINTPTGGNNASPGPCAKVQEPSGAQKSCPLQTGSNSIGRGSDNQIPLDDPKASRKHADLHVSPEGKYTLTDLGSQNGTMVNGEKISQQEICSGDRIGIGDSTITV